MRRYADELAATGRPLQEAELISFLLAGLDLDYNPLISALDARTEPITIDDLYSQVYNFDQWVSLLTGGVGFKSCANFAQHGGPPPSRGFGKPRDQKKQGGGGGYKKKQGGGGHPYYINTKGARSGAPGGPGGLGGPDGPPPANNHKGNDPIQCQICIKFGHSTKDCWYHFDDDALE